MKRAAFVPGLAIILLLCACVAEPEPHPAAGDPGKEFRTLTASPAAPTSDRAATDLASATATETPPPSAPTGTPAPFVAFSIPTSVDNVNLRANPGYLFPVLRILRQGSLLRISGRSPGGEWFFATAPDGVEGWVFGFLLEPDPRLAEAPIRAPQNVQALIGRVLDVRAIPIQGVAFSISKGSGPKAPTNTVVTDPDGTFYSFLPPDSSGVWTIAHVGIACVSNVWMNGGCESYKNGYKGSVDPPSMEIPLPHESELMFTWK
jgi:hypothetical protein